MKSKMAKIISSFAMAAMISLAGMTAQAAEAVDEEYINVTDNCDTANWDIEDYADNIREIYKMDYPEAADVIDNIVDSYLSDDEFKTAFEKDGCSVFLSVEEMLNNTLEPKAAPAVYECNTYFSIHSIPKIKQKSGYGDGAAAAALMALYGCGYYNFYQDTSLIDSQQSTLIDEIAWDSNKRTTIGEVTRIIRKHYSGSSTHTYQTKYAGSFNSVMNLLKTSFSMDAAPVIRIPDENSYYYGVVSSIYSEDDVETITIIDPRTGTSNEYSFDEFDAKLSPYYYSGIWMSVDVPDKSSQAIENVKKIYPENSHFSGSYDGGEQCAGFARYVFKEVKGRTYTLSRNSNRTGFGTRLSYSTTDDGVFSGIDITKDTARKCLQGLSTGAYVRVEDVSENRNEAYPWHSFAVLETSENGIKYYEANVDGHNLVKITDCTWSELANHYNLLFYVD